MCVCAVCLTGTVGGLTRCRVSCFSNQNNRILYSFQMATTREEKKSSAREKFKDGEMCAVVSRVEMKGIMDGGGGWWVGGNDSN